MINDLEVILSEGESYASLMQVRYFSELMMRMFCSATRESSALCTKVRTRHIFWTPKNSTAILSAMWMTR